MQNPTPQPTQHEIHILQAIVDKGTMPLAAQHLGLSVHTIDSHVDNLRRKSGQQKLIQIAVWAALKGYLRSQAT